MIRSRAGMNPEMPPPGSVSLSDYIEQVQEEEKYPLDKLMKTDCKRARAAVVHLHFLDMEGFGDKDVIVLHKFIRTVELFQKSRVKQVPALFKKGT